MMKEADWEAWLGITTNIQDKEVKPWFVGEYLTRESQEME